MKKERREAVRYLERYALWELQVKLIDEQMFENERLLHSIRDLAREEDGASYQTLLASGLKKQNLILPEFFRAMKACGYGSVRGKRCSPA